MKISDLFNINLEECEKEDLKRSIILENIRRGRLFAKVIICFEAIFAIIDICALLLKVDDRFNYDNYLMMYLLMILIGTIYLLLFKGLNNLKDKSTVQLRNLEIGLLTFVTLTSCWSSIVSLMDQKLYGQLMVFMINMIIVSVLYLLDNQKILIPYVCSGLIILIGLPFFQSSMDVLFGNYVNLCVFIFISWLASRIMFISYCNDFKSKALLKKTNTLLEKEIEQNSIINMKLAEANFQLKELALVDELTGIPNRRSFRNYIDFVFENYVKENSLLSIIMIDIDCFKQFNDNYGHNKGDKALIEVANQINSIVRHSMDFVARWGGEEFIYLAFNTNEDEIIKIAETIRIKVLELNIPNEFSEACGLISVSLGTCSITVKNKGDVSKGIEQADKALYLAKINGRNCIQSVKLNN